MGMAQTIALIKALSGNGGGGGGSGVFVVHANDQGVLDKTWKEIYDASETSVVYLVQTLTGSQTTERTIFTVSAIEHDADYYRVLFSTSGGDQWFYTDSENGYPVFSDE